MTELIQNINFQELYSNYKAWISKHPETASSLENTLKWASWFITGRFKSSNQNLLCELIYSLSKLLVLFNDRIIYKSMVGVVADDSNKCFQIKLWLTVLEYSEVFIELSMQKYYGDFGRWVAIMLIQILKTAGRLILLVKHDHTIIDRVPIPPLDRNNLNESIQNEAYGPIYVNGVPLPDSPDYFVLQSSGRVVRSLKNSPSIAQRDWKALTKENIMTPERREKIYTSELLYTVKPLIHLSSLYLFGVDTWKPWLLSLGLDAYCASTLSKQYQCLSKSQRSESDKRKILLLLYLLKSPFYEKYTRLRLERLLLNLCDYRLLKFVLNPLREYIPYWQDTYFYMWSS